MGKSYHYHTTTSVLTSLFLIFLSSLFQSVIAANSVLLACEITNVEAGEPSCNGDGTYTVDLSVSNNGEGLGTGDLVVEANGNSFTTTAISTATEQLISITLFYDGSPVDITAYYSDAPDCKFEEEGLFVSPEGCSSIGDYVWEDANGNGIQDASESGMEGLIILLTDCDGNIIDQRETDESGRFRFDFLAAGNYKVEIPLPNDGRLYEYAPTNTGSDSASDSDLNEVGTTTCYSLSADENVTDLDGGLIVCPTSAILVCNNALNIPLQDDCQVKVTPEMLVEGSLLCPSSFEVKLFDDTGFIGDVITRSQIGKTLTAFIINIQNENNLCSSEITVMDIVPPEIDCKSEVNEAFMPEYVQVLPGTLNGADPSFKTGGFTCWLDNGELDGNLSHLYENHSFQVDVDDYYHLVLFTDWGDGLGAVVQGEFDDYNPCSNILSFAASASDALPSIDQYNEFGPALDSWLTPDMKPVLQLALPLRSGKEYNLVASHYDGTAAGNYFWAIFSDRKGRLFHPVNDPFEVVEGTVQMDLICSDFDSLFNRTQSLAFLGFPDVQDNCSEITDLEFTDVIQRKSVCGPVVVDRNFTATDGSGNAQNCLQEIHIRKPSQDDVILPTATILIHCDDEDLVFDENGNPHPSITGYPLIWTAYGVQEIDQPICNIVADYSDEIRVDICDGGYTIRREWTIIDWCDVTNTMIYNQIINVADKEGPSIDLTGLKNGAELYPDTFHYSTGPFDCTSAFEVPLPEVSDNCSEDWEMAIEIVSEVQVPILDHGIPIGTKLDTQVLFTVPSGVYPVVSGIPMGCHWIRYIVTDNCGNTSTEVYPVCIEDQVEPVVVCIDNLSVSIGGQGSGRLFASNVDQGSFDACEIDRIEVRRVLETNENCDDVETTYSDFGTFVDFSCCDVGKDISLELKVTDISGNANSCWVEVAVEDKINPQCIAPEPMAIKCTDLPGDFVAGNINQLQSVFGVPDGEDNCGIESFEELDPILELDDCGFGDIVRRFKVKDVAGNESANVCTQLISILPVFNYEIKFPKDVVQTCGTPDPDTLEMNNFACDLLAVRIDEETFTTVQDACFKTFRTFTVINWCEYDELSDPVTIRRDEDCDGSVGDEDVWVLRRPDGTFIDRDNDEENQEPLFGTKGTNCDGESNPEGHWKEVVSTGYWIYTQVVKVVDNDAPELIYTEPDPYCSSDSETCSASVSVPFELKESCTPESLFISAWYDENNDAVPDQEMTVLGGYPDYEISGDFPIGAHAFEILVEDGCGNKVAYRLPFSIVDCKAPIVICIAELNTSLSPVGEEQDLDGDGIEDRGAAVVWASDFVATVTGDCSDEITYSINREGETPHPGQDSLLLLCADSASTKVEIYAWDNSYNPTAIQPDGSIGGPNYNFCTAVVNIADNLGLCRSTAGVITGMVATPENERVNGVEIRLSGEQDQMIITGANGVFNFEGLIEGIDYTIAPFLDDRHNNGVTTFDIIIISRHILGVTPLESPYKMVAADADNSKKLSTLDLIRLRKLILGIESRLPTNTSWRFIDASYRFPIAGDPWFEEFPESVTINELGGIMEDINFMAVKVGDVNNSASLIDTKSLGNGGRIESRTIDKGFNFEITTLDQSLNVGHPIEVWLNAGEVLEVDGFQFTLDFDPAALELIDIDYGLLREANIGQQMVERGLITTSWDRKNMELVEEKLLGLVFRAHEPGYLSDFLEINSVITTSEAYLLDGEHIGVALAFEEEETSDAPFRLYQNRPNPVRSFTQISFDLPKQEHVQFQVFDVTGKSVMYLEQIFPAGRNSIDVDCAEMPEGLLTYSLETATQKAVRKMVIVK